MKIICFFILLILYLGCDNNQYKLTEESYAVYSAIIDSMYKSCEYKLVNNRLQPIEYPKNMNKSDYIEKNTKRYFEEYKEIDILTIEDYFTNMDKSFNLKDYFTSLMKIKLLPDSILKKQGFNNISKIFPKSKGIITFSIVGFNKFKTEAFLYIENYYNPLSAFGRFMYLKKINSKWKIKHYKKLWVS